MTTTLKNLRDEISDDLSRTDLNSQINTAINRAIKHYSGHSFWFNESRDLFVTANTQQVYTSANYPTDVHNINQIEIMQNGVKYPVYKKTYNFLTTIDAGQTVGLPKYWTWFDNSIYFYPTPDASYTAYVSYNVQYTALSADGDNNDFTNNAEDLLCSYAIWWLYSRVINDTEQAQIAAQNESTAFTSLMTISNAKDDLENTPIRPTSF